VLIPRERPHCLSVAAHGGSPRCALSSGRDAGLTTVDVTRRVDCGWSEATPRDWSKRPRSYLDTSLIAWFARRHFSVTRTAPGAFGEVRTDVSPSLSPSAGGPGNGGPGPTHHVWGFGTGEEAGALLRYSYLCDGIAIRGWSIVLKRGRDRRRSPFGGRNCDLHHTARRSRNGYRLVTAGLGLGRCRRVVGF
jgi:hypothetical protein